MPEKDLRTLKADFLLQNLELAYQARKDFPWAKAVPEDLFLNNVLPYAHVDESRDPWRKELLDLAAPMVKGCKTATEAVMKLDAAQAAEPKPEGVDRPGESLVHRPVDTFELYPDHEYVLTVGKGEPTALRTKAAGTTQLIEVKVK